jgi:arylsulfatase A-like enzyme
MQVDVAPTILAALGIAPDPRMQGVDLLGSVRSPRQSWSEVEDGFVRKASLRVDGWKLVHGPLGADVRIPNEREWELYDLARDPGEGAEASEREPERLATLQAQFEAFREHLRTMRETLGPLGRGTEIDEGTQRQLEHLGYGGGGE